MALIDVSQAQVGMVLAADVLDRRGRMLIPAGKELIGKHLNALPAWGVAQIEVEGDDVGGAAELEEWAIAAATEEIDELFSLSNRAHPALEKLAEVCTYRKAVLMQAARAEGGAE